MQIVTWYIAYMPFVPTEKQIDSLHTLLRQLVRERTEIRLIRFMKMAEPSIGGNIIEVLCFEDVDRYRIYYDGKAR